MEYSRKIVRGIYKHFKGKLYEVLNVASYHDWSNKYPGSTSPTIDMVIYRALYDDPSKGITYGSVFYREYDMFASEVDHVKYPDVKQKYRFEFIEHV